jgi:hypothetical protein
LSVYSNPEKFGLKHVADLDFSSGSYEFDTTAVWVNDKVKKFYWADDSGCSCPSPFEGFSTIEQLNSGPFEQVRDHLTSRFDGGGWGGYVKITELHPVVEKLHKIKMDWGV